MTVNSAADSGTTPVAAGRHAQTTDEAASLAARLQDPKTANALSTLLDHADLLAILVVGLDQFVSRSEVIGDSLLAGISELRETRLGAEGAPQADFGAVASSALTLAGLLPKAAPGMVSAVESGAVDKLLASAEVSASALDQVNLLAQGVIAGSQSFQRGEVAVSGPISLVKLMRDPDVSRAISYFAAIAKAVGRELNQPRPGSAS